LGSQLDPLPLFRVGSRERATMSQFPQLDFVKLSSGFHPVTWEHVKLCPWCLASNFENKITMYSQAFTPLHAFEVGTPEADQWKIVCFFLMYIFSWDTRI